MSEYICTKSLYESRNIPNFCRCFKCREERESKKAIEFYRRAMAPEATFCEPLPEKEES